MHLLVYLVTQCDWCFSIVCLLFVCALCAPVIPLVVTGCVSALPRAPARAYFARYLTVMVKIRILESIFPVFLAGSLVLVGFTLTVKLTHPCSERRLGTCKYLERTAL